MLVAYIAEGMARSKRLGEPKKWLDMVSQKQRRRSSAHDVLSMFESFKAAGVPLNIKIFGKDS